MNKNEYARSNKEWLAGKAKEDGVTQLRLNSLLSGTNVWQKGA